MYLVHALSHSHIASPNAACAADDIVIPLCTWYTHAHTHTQADSHTHILHHATQHVPQTMAEIYQLSNRNRKRNKEKKKLKEETGGGAGGAGPGLSVMSPVVIDDDKDEEPPQYVLFLLLFACSHSVRLLIDDVLLSSFLLSFFLSVFLSFLFFGCFLCPVSVILPFVIDDDKTEQKPPPYALCFSPFL